MKTRRQQIIVWFAAAAFLALTSGCGAPSAATADQEKSAAGSVETNAPPASISSETNLAEGASAGEAVPTEVLRSERTTQKLKPEVADVVHLVESGAGEEVVRAYVAASAAPYDLSLDEIVYLRDIGIPDGVIAAMMRRGGELRAEAADAATLQTNLVAAVEQLKDAVATRPGPNASYEAPPEAEPGANPEPDQASGPPPPADAPETVQQFYSDLSPYGNWYQVPTYGWVWQPSVVAVNPVWAPYRYGGRWLWTDNGWYWCSDYSWGWAPFHYGRWCTYPGLGWCWTPGSVWGPSWVSWRYTDDCVGWAPLPPACGWSVGVGLTWYGAGIDVGFGFGLSSSCFTFVHNSNFCYRDVGRHCLNGSQVAVVYQHSRVANNYTHGDQHTMVNHGVGYAKVAASVRGEVPKARIDALPNASSRVLRADRLERSPSGLVVYKPTPIDGKSDRPSRLRTEVGPSPAKTSVPVTTAPSRMTRPIPSRTGPASHFATATPHGDSVTETGTPTGSASPLGSRSFLPSSRTGSYASPRANSWNGTTPMAPNATQLRSNRSSPTPYGGERDSSPLTTPSRQTLPVPLADPSRNIPPRMMYPGSRNNVPINPARPAYEGRNAAGQNSDYPRWSRPSGTAPSQGASRMAPQESRGTPSAPAYRTQAAPSAAPQSRPSYSAPAPAAAPAGRSQGGGMSSAPAMSRSGRD